MNMPYKEVLGRLQKTRVPCRVKEMQDGRVMIECGWDYPDKVFDDILDALGSHPDNVEISAEHHGGMVVNSTLLNGGPKNYRAGGFRGGFSFDKKRGGMFPRRGGW